MNNTITLVQGDEIFATGVLLKALKVTINGIEQVRWVATSFEDSTFHNGEEIDVYTYADSFEKLIINNHEES